MIVRSAFLSLTFLLVASAAGAQDVPATPAPAPAPYGFSGRAHITMRIPMHGSTIVAGARVAVAQRDQLTRVDLIGVDAPVIPIPIPPLTFVINRRTNTVTAWNDTARVYFTQSFLPPGLGGVAPPTPLPGLPIRPSGREHSALANLDLLTFDMRLTGHSTTANIASTGLAFDMKLRQHGKSAITHLTGTLQLADDFAFFPAAIAAQITGNGLATPASFTYAVDAFDRHVPAPESFVVPDGYREAPSLLGVFTGVARRNPIPVPSASASAAPQN